MRNDLLKLLVIQFALYTTFGMLGFATWAMTFTNNLSTLKLTVGEYISEHLRRWTIQFPLWGILILISAVLSFGATYFIWHTRKVGGYLGIASFSLGFVTNILLARNMLVHSFISALIGWALLAPLVVAWKNLNSNNTKK